MRFGHDSRNWSDVNGNDIGGVSHGLGFVISWQYGPLAVDGDRKQPNGAFVEDVLEAVKRRLEVYQKGKFPCKENEGAIRSIEEALSILDARTLDREARGVEGTHAE